MSEWIRNPLAGAALYRTPASLFEEKTGLLSTLSTTRKEALKTYVIEWRVKRALTFIDHLRPTPIGEAWTPLEHEEWLPQEAAELRLKYWKGLSLSKLVAFRVVSKEITLSGRGPESV